MRFDARHPAVCAILCVLCMAGFAYSLNPEVEAQPHSQADARQLAQRDMPADAASFVAAQIRQGLSAAMGSSSLSLGNVRFGYSAIGSDRYRPQLSFTVTNVGDHHIASFSVDARLYLNGATEPSVGTDFGRLYNKPFFVHLGDAGLRPGETRGVSVVFGLDAYHWTRASLLQARSHAVALRIVDVSDVHMRRLDERSPPFKEPAPAGSHAKARTKERHSDQPA